MSRLFSKVGIHV